MAGIWRRFFTSFAVAGLVAGSFASEALAQNWPQQKPITMIVPFGAGGGSDILARTIQDELQKGLGQTVVVDARPGANGAIGTTLVAKSPPDGYTIVLGATSTFSLNPVLMKDVTYDQLKDFAGIGTLVRSPWMLAVSSKSPYKSVDDLVKAAKAEPGKISYGFWQSSVLTTAEVFGQTAGIQLRKVPYKGSVEAINDLIGGRISMIFIDISGVRSFVEAGEARFLAATTAKRVSLLPDVPTLTEAGYPVVTDSVSAFFAPAATPPAILDKFNAEFIRIVRDVKVVRDKFVSMGLEPTAMTRKELDDFVRSELPRWEAMVKRAGLEKE
jgi:tripartite-type tricarboxylate transporter receptor subunit TctC